MFNFTCMSRFVPLFEQRNNNVANGPFTFIVKGPHDLVSIKEMMGEEDRKLFISRIGTFFLLLGIFGVVLFIASDIGKETKFSYFFLGVLFLALGWYFNRISAPPPVPGKRFEGIRFLQKKSREAKTKTKTEKNDKDKKK